MREEEGIKNYYEDKRGGGQYHENGIIKGINILMARYSIKTRGLYYYKNNKNVNYIDYYN